MDPAQIRKYLSHVITPNRIKLFGIIFGLIGFFGFQLLDTNSITPDQKKTLSVMFLMATWWMSSAFHMSVIALLPLILFPTLSVDPMKSVAQNYASSTIFLFMGGFMMAEGLKKWNLHHRFALHIVKRMGGRQSKTLAGFMFSSFFLSMWISNTATAVMLIPIALSVYQEINHDDNDNNNSFIKCLTLGIAYSASVGGISTLIGTPPNLILAGQLPSLAPDLPEIEFGQWILFALPLSLVFFLFIWAYLSRTLRCSKCLSPLNTSTLDQQLDKLGPISYPEKVLILLVTGMIGAWMTRSDVNLGFISLSGWQSALGLTGVDDSTVAIFFALMLCFIPVKIEKWTFLLTWADIEKIPWSVIFLFGGGFALANTAKSTGLTTYLGTFMGHLSDIPLISLILILALATSFLTEVTSNTATISILLPILAAASEAIDINPLLLMIPATISASMAFMLPVATPPNAIAFASGQLETSDMARAGFVLNIVGALWITLYIYFIGPYFFAF